MVTWLIVSKHFKARRKRLSDQIAGRPGLDRRAGGAKKVTVAALAGFPDSRIPGFQPTTLKWVLYGPGFQPTTLKWVLYGPGFQPTTLKWVLYGPGFQPTTLKWMLYGHSKPMYG